MKFSGKMCVMTILKVTKNQGFILFSEDTFFKKQQGWDQIDPPSRFRVKDVLRRRIQDVLQARL